eukprot:TRINITY_DN14983_c0_g1_i1.p1 TRINITY_DN14983_c0_g1~~TRINITY_DN14983_c0_g1_i1.p1  ORF type:complete len:300 (-),score=44.93 TRINITY_DN14983_c0_g1_i1:65-964(-)
MKTQNKLILGCITFVVMFVIVQSQYNDYQNYNGYSSGNAYAHDRIPLAEISALTFRRGAMTTARRGRPIQQLSCVGGSAQYSRNQPDTVQCTNVGTSYDGSGVQWKCEADMQSNYKFGNLRVSCEGYDSPTDPYVLKGSCGLEYELNEAERDHYEYHQQNQRNPYQHNTYHQESSGTRIFGFSIPTLIIIFAIIYCCCFRSDANYATPNINNPSTGGYYNQGSAGSNSYTTSSGSGSGSGWWTGAATGGLLGYLWGRNSTPRYTNTSTYSQPSYNGTSTTHVGTTTRRTATGYADTQNR